MATGSFRVKNGTINLTPQASAPSSPELGDIYVDSNGDLQKYNGLSFAAVAAGSSGINVVPSASQISASGWGSTNATLSTITGTNNPLNGVTASAISVTSSTSGGYAQIRWTMPAGLQNQPINISFWSQLTVSSDYKVELYYNAASNYGGSYTRVSLNSDVSGISNLNSGSTQFKTFFVEQGQSYYELRLVRTAGTSAAAYFTQVGVGVLSQLGTGYSGNDWYTPTVVPVLKYGTTTATNIAQTYCKVRKQGDSLDIKIMFRFNGAANANGGMIISMPDALIVDANKVDRTGGYGYQAQATLFTSSKFWLGNAYVDEANSVLAVQQIDGGSSTGGATPTNWAGNTTAASNVPSAAALANNDFIEIVYYGIPIVNWSSNTTIADRALEEYVFNSAAATAAGASELTSFGYGSAGITFNSFASTTANSATTLRVQFQTPIQPTDKIFVEYQRSDNVWQAVSENAADICSYMNQGDSYYGMGYNRVAGSSTQLDVVFGNKGRIPSQNNGAAFAADGGVWSGLSGRRWRIRKVSGGASVGYPIAPSNIVKSIARMSKNSTQTIANTAEDIVAWTTTTFDTKREMTTGASANFTAKQTGYYRISAVVTSQGFTPTAVGTSEGDVGIFVNNVLNCYGALFDAQENTTALEVSPQVHNIVQLNAGDVVTIKFRNAYGLSVTISSAASRNYFNVEQIG